MKMTRRLLALLLAFCLTFGNVMPAMATELAAEEPVVTEEPVVVPEVEETEAPAEEPEVTEAPVVEPEVTEAPVVEPEVTEAPVVEPEVTEAPVVEPEVTEAPVVEPEVTEAPVVEPEVTEAPVVEEPEEVEAEGEDTATLTETTIANGVYVISTNGLTLAALAEEKSFGYPSANAAAAYTTNDKVTITNVDGGITVQDCFDRYLSSSADYNSVTVGTATSADGSHIWKLMTDGTSNCLVNTVSNRTLAYSTDYSSWGVYTDVSEGYNYGLTFTAYVEPDEPEEPEVTINGELLATFTFPAKDSTTWSDGSAFTAKEYAEDTENGYTLSFVNGSGVYSDGNDTTGKGFIKFGTKSVAGELTFTVLDNVNSVVVRLAGYKANNAYYTINGGATQSLTKQASSGEYEDVVIDTSTNKTVTISTATGGYRMVMYSVAYYGEVVELPDEPEFEKPTTPEAIIAAAAALANDAVLDGGEYELTGEIIGINTAYDDYYGNITVTIAVDGVENNTDYSVKCYRLTGNGIADLKIGDTITVTGSLTKKYDNIRFDAGCALGTVVAGEAITAPETPEEIAAAVYGLTTNASLPYDVTLTGVITDITDAYSSQYGNITLLMAVEGYEDKAPLKCYRLKGTGADNLAVGDTITVTGSVQNYEGQEIEFNQGCVLTAVELAAGRTEENPFLLYRNMFSANGTYDVTIPEGASVMYYALYNAGGMQLAIGDAEPIALTGNMMNPDTFSVTADCTLTLSYPAGHMENPETIWGVGAVYSTLEAGDFDGYYYTFEVENDGTLEFRIDSVTEGVEVDIIVNGMQYLSIDGVDGVLYIPVVAGDELSIQVVALPDASFVYPAAEIEWSFNYPAGTELNPIRPDFNMDETGAFGETTVTIPAGETYYFITNSAGMELYVNGEFVKVLEGNFYNPPVFNLTNDTNEDAVYTLRVQYPVGTYENPDVIYGLGSVSTALEEGDSDGYCYGWTVEHDGTLEFRVDSASVEGVEADIIINRGWKTLLADGVDGVLSVDVAAGDLLKIEIAAPLVTGEGLYQTVSYPAVDVEWSFNYPAGTELNPFWLEGEMSDNGWSMDVTVTVPAHTTHFYQSYAIAGMELLINNDYYGMMQATNPMMRAPVVFPVVNDTDEAAEFNLHFEYPLGSSMRPDANVSYYKLDRYETQENYDFNGAYLAEGNDQGYFYKFVWEEPSGELKIRGFNGVAGWSYVINNLTAGIYGDMHYSTDRPLQEVDSIKVNPGDEIQIVINSCGSGENRYPGGQVMFGLCFVEAYATEEYPVMIENWESNGDDTEFWSGVAVPAGKTYYFSTYQGGGMALYVNDEFQEILVSAPRNPAVFSITNDSDEWCWYDLHLITPAGSSMKPARLFVGENTASIAAGSQGYYYTYTAPSDGTIQLKFSSSWYCGWSYVINNMTTYTYGDTQSSDSDPVVDTVTMEVAAGDEIQVIVNTYDPENPYNAPEGNVYVTLTEEGMEYTVGSHESNPYVLTINEHGDVIDENGNDIIDRILAPGESVYYSVYLNGKYTIYAESMSHDVTLKVNGETRNLADGQQKIDFVANRFAGPVIVSFTNQENEDVMCRFSMGPAFGSMDRPEYLEMGTHTVDVDSDGLGYHYAFWSEDSGYLTITMNTKDNWSYVINNPNASLYGETRYASDGVKTETIFVPEYSDVQLIIGTEEYMTENTISFTTTFASKRADVMIGKSATLSFTNPANGKAVSASKAKWKIAAVWGEEVDIGSSSDFAKYATISSKGKITAKKLKITQPVYVLVEASLKSNASVTNAFLVVIHPKTTAIRIDADCYGQVATDMAGKTVPLYLNMGSIYLNAITGPEGAAMEDVTWKSSNTKILTVGDTDKTGCWPEPVWNTKTDKFNTGVVTLTATAKDGSGVKASIKVNVSYLADWVEIQSPEYVGTGKSVQLTARVDPEATVQDVNWAIVERDEDGNWVAVEEENAVATINANGVLTAKEGLTEECEVHVLATVKDYWERPDVATLTIVPAASKVMITEGFEDFTQIEGSTERQYYLNHGYELTPMASAYVTAKQIVGEGDEAYEEDVIVGQARCGVKWTSSNTKIAEADEDIIRFTGKSGKVTLTATATDGSGASESITVNVLKAPEGIAMNKNVAALASGKSVTLKASIEDDDVTNKKVTLKLEDLIAINPETQESKIVGAKTVGVSFSKGKLSVKASTFNKWYKKNGMYVIAYVSATAQMAQENGEKVQNYAEILIGPAIKKFDILNNGTKVNGKTLGLDVNDIMILSASTPAGLEGLESVLYTWKSSNTKIATVEQNLDGSITVVPTGTKTGTVTITAKATDGSGKSASMKVRVVDKAESVTIDTSNFALSGANTKKGRTFKLNSLVTVGPEETTMKSVVWSIASESAATAKANKITLSSSGTLTAKKNVAAPVTIKVIAKAADGLGAEAEAYLTITPSTTKVTIADLQGETITGTQSVYVGQGMGIKAISASEDAADLFSWKTASKYIADVETDEAGNVYVVGKRPGTVKITATAKDGSGKTATIKVKVIQGNPEG